MIERILEPEVMDTPQEAMDYDDMDHHAVNKLFVDDLIAFLGVTPNREAEMIDILDLGTGTARIPIILADRIPQCRIMGADASIAMLDVARINIDIAGMLDRIQLMKVDAKQIAHEDGFFTGVMSNSIVHHITEPLTVLQESVRMVEAGGWLFFRDLLRPDSVDQLNELVETYCGQEIESSRKMFAESLHAALALDEIREMIVSLGFPAESVQQTSDRHWTWAARKAT
ncbi:class I SAM-dependent methyltransferase [Blastopirellula marina]|uniref:Ubiquinone biosynthesis protein UbiE n=1 Tax=Blastopirellula marina TaxID=124 RepID=A0A2S8FIK7_9BACT|nr:class I SAM-dependent methyltransferase [Blastopirellula marina]PQO31764.1 ubiquinone biosynthesis protein UbiE [Blastopirellula marina]PTL43071.1 class I SAM-dependent methyltransferase [Blastopirellula marina]